MTALETQSVEAATAQPRRLEHLYLRTRQRVADLVSEAGDETCATAAAPACPHWTVHDVVAHLSGLVADVFAGRLAGMTTDAWTGAQVEARRDLATSAIVAEWEGNAPTFAAMLGDFPGLYGAQVVADVTVHEQDIRSALRKPGMRDSEELHRSLDLLMTVVTHPAAAALRVGPVEVIAGAQSWTVGGPDVATSADVGEAINAVLTSGEALPASAEPAVATLTADPFDLFRAITGRRSASQIRAFAWSVADAAPYLALFGHGPFRLRPHDLHE